MKHTHHILYRNIADWSLEESAAKTYFKCIRHRAKMSFGNLIIPRYSSLPYYRELEEEALVSGAKLINSYNQHIYVADLKNWYYDLKDYTPKTWLRLEDIPETGPFVLKGETNSRKNWWKTHMFAENKRQAINVQSNLISDSLIGEQDIYIREYIPLYTYFEGIQGQPITKEFRFFVAFGEIISGGFYWSNYVSDIEEKIDIDEVPTTFLSNIVDKVKDRINFFVMDVAQTKSGDWVLIELNDGTMSGISENDPDTLYKNLKTVCEEKWPSYLLH